MNENLTRKNFEEACNEIGGEYSGSRVSQCRIENETTSSVIEASFTRSNRSGLMNAASASSETSIQQETVSKNVIQTPSRVITSGNNMTLRNNRGDNISISNPDKPDTEEEDL